MTWRQACLGVALALMLVPAGQAASWSYCDQPARANLVQTDRMLRFGHLVENILDETAAQAVVVSRSGFDLERFGLHYSHAGVMLRDEVQQGWSVRQLYFDCAAERPRIYDQGIPGFLLGNEEDLPTFISMVFLPPDEERRLAVQAHSKPVALSLLGQTYSANAYPFSTRYQNCNQWALELLAYAWGNISLEAPDRRAAAQGWLKAQGYQPTQIRLGPFLDVASWFVPLVNRDDHPANELAEGIVSLSMPDAVEDFVHQQVPAATRLEICLKDTHVVIRKGWRRLDAKCVAEPTDQVMQLQ
ncbi:DUF2145 domain-containing protein [Uliginosibacterium gangwonense]|uniref:DUF2145 domain-containing protein n=1 Tax=Uliginosibacterium gangwonense TaxID=392736 RepID=UPI00035D563F|nr:DUF2145 domain-containing protein [Uliginosibacterium gangwonense]